MFSTTTHTILKSKKYFSTLTMLEVNVNTISDSTNLIESFDRANLILSRGTKFTISNVLFSSKWKRNLLSFKDIRQNGYHVSEYYIYCFTWEAYIGNTACLFFLITLYSYTSNWNICKHEPEVHEFKYVYSLAWSIGSSWVNNDEKNYWKFSWMATKEPEESWIQWIIMYCLLSKKINY